MSLFRIDHVPVTIKGTLPLYVILPDPEENGKVELAKRKVLYLLHGLSEDASAWQRYTCIETIAAAYGLVVVMPSGGRSFYINQPNGQAYFSYLTEELPHYLTEVFGLSTHREDTFIAGSSMGGYGAFKAALQRPELYAAAASFSGVLSIAVLQLLPQTDPRRDEFALLFGELETLVGGEHDPAVWLENAAKNTSQPPRLFISVSRQEDIYPLSGMFHEACQSLGVQSEYHEEDGGHDWLFWDRQIRRFLSSVLGPMPTT
jgi:putative tributyrin esterase